MVLTPGLLESLPVWFATNNPDNDTLTSEQASSSTTVLAFQDNDTITGSQNGDVIYGGQGNDELFGQAGADTLFGNKDTDLLDGSLGDDLLWGGSGSDLLVGGEGVDTLIGDREVDIYKGGEAGDVFVLRTDQAGQIQEINSLLSLIPGVPDEIELPDAIITDFNAANDQIGLTEGLTRQEITFETFNSQETFGVTTNFILPIVLSSVPNALDFLEKGGISPEDLDPDDNGVLTGTAIRITENNQLLGYVLNVEPEVLGNLGSDRFVSADGLF
jgi:Ca2+-binding RTX toxin-like protein